MSEVRNKIDGPATVFVGWKELCGWLGAWGFSLGECERLRAQGVIVKREFGPGVRGKYDWAQVAERLGLDRGEGVKA
jgi:hypothetical protein